MSAGKNKQQKKRSSANTRTPNTVNNTAKRGFTFFFLLSIAFLFSRAFLVFFFDAEISDMKKTYAVYGYEYRLAKLEKKPFYQYHAERIQGIIDFQLKNYGKTNFKESQKTIEYPPLSMAWIVLPDFFVNKDYHTSEPAQFDLYADEYKVYFKLFSFLLDLAGFAALVWLVKRIYGNESNAERGWRLLFYILSGIILAHLWYERLDTVLAVLIVLALALLVTNKNYLWSYLVLAIAINYKLIPVLLAPVWVIASLPAASRLNKKLVYQLAVRALAMLVINALIFIPFYMEIGNDTLKFLIYHKERGVQIESLYSSLIFFFAQLFGFKYELYFGTGAWNVDSALSAFFTGFFPIAMLLCIAVTSVAYLYTLFNVKKENADSTQTFALQYPEQVITFSLMVMMLAMAFSKVFSTQYLIWIVPLIALLPGNKKFVIISGSFIFLFLITTFIFPYHFGEFIGFETNHIPSDRMMWLLIIRNFGFTAISLWLLIESIKTPYAANKSEKGKQA